MNIPDIDLIIQQLTLDEKARLCSGLNNADTKPIDRLDIPSVKMPRRPKRHAPRG